MPSRPRAGERCLCSKPQPVSLAAQRIASAGRAQARLRPLLSSPAGQLWQGAAGCAGAHEGKHAAEEMAFPPLKPLSVVLLSNKCIINAQSHWTEYQSP